MPDNSSDSGIGLSNLGSTIAGPAGGALGGIADNALDSVMGNIPGGDMLKGVASEGVNMVSNMIGGGGGSSSAPAADPSGPSNDDASASSAPSPLSMIPSPE